MADLVVRAEREALVVTSSGVNCSRSRCAAISMSSSELLVARDEARLQPAGGVEQEVRAGQERRQHRVEALERRLRVGPLAGRERAAARAPRQAEAARDLAGGEQADRRLRPAEAGRARLHVGVREERAEHDRRARPHELHVARRPPALGRLLHERRRDRDRRHRAHQQERRDDHGDLPAPRRSATSTSSIAHVVAQRRVDVGDAVHRRRPLAAPRGRRRRSPAMRERVARLVAGEQRRRADLVGQRQLRVGACRGAASRAAGRSARTGGSARRVDLVERVPELDEAAPGRRSSPSRRSAPSRTNGAPGDAAEHHVVAAEHEVARRVAGVHRELARRLRDLLEQEVGIEPHDAVVRHVLARPRGSRCCACGRSKRMPISDTSRRQPPSSVSIASSDSTS